MVGAEVRHKGELLFIYKIISIFEIMVTQKEGKKWWLHFKHFSGSSLKALGATSWISFAALLIRRCVQSFKTLSLEKTFPPRSCRKRFS